MNNPFLENFRKYALQTGWQDTHTDTPFLVAVSGGLDSVVLGWLFFLEKIPFAVAHVNFKLRGESSDLDAQFVENLSKIWGTPFFKTEFDTATIAQQSGESIQTCARNLRRAWFEEVRTTQKLAAIALAHHLDDQIETVLFNFSRGTGLAGLRGMLPVREQWVRPLLFATRAEILSFAHEQNFEWREDASNATDDYSRNFVRHHIVPAFLKLNPHFHKIATQNFKKTLQTEQNHRYFLEKWLHENAQMDAATGWVVLSKKHLELLPAPEELLQFWLQPFGFDAEQCRQVVENLERQPGHVWQSDSHQLNLDRTALLLAPRRSEELPPFFLHPDDLMVTLPESSGRLILMPLQSFGWAQKTSDPNTILIDADDLQYPLCLRTWQPGDVFQPHGLEGKSKKVKDFLTDSKLPKLEKQQQMVLTDAQNRIIWVVGRRADHRFRVKVGTENALKIGWVRE